jgi:hypothetical protein
MTYTTDELRKLQNYYGAWAVYLLLKWGDRVKSIGRPVGNGPWVNREGAVCSTAPMFTIWDSNDAARVPLLAAERKTNDSK